MDRRILACSFAALLAVAALFIVVAKVRANYSCWELHRSESAYRRGDYYVARTHLDKAATAEAKKPSAYLCRAEANMRRTTWSTDAPIDSDTAQKAIADYRAVLAVEPNNLEALKGAAQILQHSRRLDEARSYYERAVELRPTDADSFLALGVISWSKAYQQRMTLAASLGRHESDPLVDLVQCPHHKAAVEQQVNDALRFLQKTLNLDSTRADAMTYLNLTYRERAQIQCGDPAAYRRDISEADNWVEKAWATMKSKASH